MYWIETDTLGVVWTNRVQNSSITSECRSNGLVWDCISVHDFDVSNGWLMIHKPFYGNHGTSFLQILPKRISADNRHYQHIAMITKGGLPVFLTDGKMVVTDVLGWHGSEQKIYYVGTEVGDPGSRHLHVVHAESKENKCLTCSLETSDDCKFNKFYLSPNYKYFVQVCYGPAIGNVVVRRTADLSIIQNIENNQEVKDKLKGKRLTQTMMLTVTVPGNFKAPVIMHLPANYNPNSRSDKV